MQWPQPFRTGSPGQVRRAVRSGCSSTGTRDTLQPPTQEAFFMATIDAWIWPLAAGQQVSVKDRSRSNSFGDGSQQSVFGRHQPVHYGGALLMDWQRENREADY
ncbi:hypothetical protein HSE3_gp041 [Klebsiella phage vB_KleS-HSE3]|nr:hypothetical protein HSE3_gp041 [Klebsiella phage vB_KleS-HSE3]